MRCPIPVRVALLFTFLGLVVAGEAPLAARAVVVVMDGARWSETWGDPKHALVPHLAADLAPQGAMLTRFENRGPTVTNPGHAAIATGIYHPNLPNDGGGALAAPSFLQAWRVAGGHPASAAWVVAGKPKLDVLATCGLDGWQQRDLPSHDCGDRSGRKPAYRSDAATIDVALAILGRDRPGVMLINLADVDANGHRGDMAKYRDAIRRADAEVFRLWQFLTTDATYAGQTLFILTNDHGRHADDAPAAQGKVAIKDHGCGCQGCRHLLAFIAGPGVKKGVEIDTPAEQIDLAPTIAHWLGFPLASAKGRVWEEIQEKVPVPAP